MFPAYHHVCNMNANSAQILFAVFGGLCCLLPLILGPKSTIEDSELRTAMLGDLNKDTAIATLAISLPILMDVAVELFTSFAAKGNFEKLNMYLNRPLLNPFERIVFLTGSTLVASTAFLPRDTPNAAYIYVCFSRCQLMLFAGAILTSLCRYDEKFWSVRSTYFILLLTFVSSVMGVLNDNASSKSLHLKSMCTVSKIFGLVAGGSLSILCFRWMYITIPKLTAQSNSKSTKQNKETTETTLGDTSSLIFTTMYVTATLITLLLLIVFKTGHESYEKYNKDALFQQSLVTISYLLFVTSVSTKMMKNELIQSLYNLVMSKKMYVHCISNELRTPLNSAFLGLKLVCDDLGISIDSRDSQHCETLMDVQSACRTAVEILNDLLCFDKLESGILEIHKQEVQAIPFIVDCVGMFASQARELGVTVSVVTSDINQVPLADAGDLSLPLTTGLFEGDTVSIDKFKMDQALRNLISNALKFTPSGGSVTVSACFVPEKADETPSPDTKAPLQIKDHFSFMEFFGRQDLNLNLPFHPHPRPWKQKIYAVTGRETAKMKQNQNQNPTQVMDAEQQYRIDLESGNDCSPIDPTLNQKSPGRSPSQLSSGLQRSNESGDSFRQLPVYASGRKAMELSLNFSSDSSITTTRQQMLRRVKPAPTTNRSRVPSASSARNAGGVISTGKLRISVSDTGAGITEEDQRRLFKGMVQSNDDAAQAGGGSGLGLWITSSIVHMHAGSIKVQSGGIGKGSTFTVEVDMQRWIPHRRALPSRIVCPPPRVPVAPIHTAKRSSSDQRYLARSSEDRMKDMDKDRDRSSHGMHSEYSSVFVGLEGREMPENNPDSAFDWYGPPVVRPAGPPQLGGRTRRAPMRTGDDISTISDQSQSHTQNQNAGELLIVEDSLLNRKMLCKLLRSSGYTCEEACDGLGAVEKVKAKMARGPYEKSTYDAILMDFVMPNVDGPTATDVIRGLGYKGPVFGLTGNTSGSDVNYFKKCGADAVLTKPFDILIFKHLMTMESEFQNPSINRPETENVNEH